MRRSDAIALARFSIEDRGLRARDARYAVRIHDRDWLSDDRGQLEQLLAALRTLTRAGTNKPAVFGGAGR